MTMTRKFSLECDKCHYCRVSHIEAQRAVEVARLNKWHLRNYEAICPTCWAGGARFAKVAIATSET